MESASGEPEQTPERGLTLLVEDLHSFPLVARTDQPGLNPGQRLGTLTTFTKQL